MKNLDRGRQRPERPSAAILSTKSANLEPRGPAHRQRGPRRSFDEAGANKGYRPPPGTLEKALKGEEKPRGLGTLEPDGYRPPNGTIEAVLRDDRPIFDRGKWNERRPPMALPGASKKQLEEELRQAVLNTAAMQKPE